MVIGPSMRFQYAGVITERESALGEHWTVWFGVVRRRRAQINGMIAGQSSDGASGTGAASLQKDEEARVGLVRRLGIGQ
jgi:hypothetical protein